MLPDFQEELLELVDTMFDFVEELFELVDVMLDFVEEQLEFVEFVVVVLLFDLFPKHVKPDI